MPASTPEEAQAKWERKTADAADKWEANVQSPSRSVSEGLADFWTGDEDNASEFSEVESSWSTEVSSAIEDGRYASSVEGKGSKWASAAERGARNAASGDN